MMPIYTTAAKIAISPKLLEAVSFTEDDLPLNEDGYLSETQKNRLKPKVELYLWLCVICSFFTFCLALIGFFAGDNSFGFQVLQTLSIAVFGIGFYGIVWSSNQKTRILKGYGIKKIEGLATLFIYYSGRYHDIPNYILKINGVNFRLNDKMYNAFEEREYRVYYYRLLRNELLAAEPIN